MVTKGFARLGVLAGAACLAMSGAVPSQAAGSPGWRVVARFASPHAAATLNSVAAPVAGRRLVSRRGAGRPALAGQLLAFGPRNVWLLGSYAAGSRTIAFARHYDGSR